MTAIPSHAVISAMSPQTRERLNLDDVQMLRLESAAIKVAEHLAAFLRISVISLGGELAFGLCSDPEAISGLGELRSALGDSIAELEGAL